MTTQLSEQTILAELQAVKADNEILRESMTTLAIQFEDIGWTRLLGEEMDTDGPSLDSLKKMYEPLRDLAGGNPLMKRGEQLRHAYIFGRGVVFSGVKPAAKSVMEDPYNKACMFSVNGYATMNRTIYTDGNYFLIYDERTKALINVPMDQITAVQTHESDSSRVQYLRRTWTANGKERQMWYPLNKFKASNKIADSLDVGGKKEAVDQRAVIFHYAPNKQSGWTFGLPDSFAAALWAKAYSEYLQDNKKLVKALSQFAWKVTQNTKAGVANAAAQVKTPGTAGTAVLAQGTDLNAIPRAGSDVNFNNGQPLAAMVAASLGVSVIALLSSPGASGGSYGAAQTLDFPTIRVMQAAQDGWIEFFEEVLHYLKSVAATASFPAIETDPVYRELSVMAQMVELGLLYREEGRGLAVQRLDIAEPKAGLPELPDSQTGGVVPKQGNTGVGNPASDISNHDGDNDA